MPPQTVDSGLRTVDFRPPTSGIWPLAPVASKPWRRRIRLSRGDASLFQAVKGGRGCPSPSGLRASCARSCQVVDGCLEPSASDPVPSLVASKPWRRRIRVQAIQAQSRPFNAKKLFSRSPTNAARGDPTSPRLRRTGRLAPPFVIRHPCSFVSIRG